MPLDSAGIQLVVMTSYDLPAQNLFHVAANFVGGKHPTTKVASRAIIDKDKVLSAERPQFR